MMPVVLTSAIGEEDHHVVHVRSEVNDIAVVGRDDWRRLERRSADDLGGGKAQKNGREHVEDLSLVRMRVTSKI